MLVRSCFCAIDVRRRACKFILSHLEDGLAVVAKKVVASCDKPRVAASQALNLGSPICIERYAHAGN